MKVLVFTTQFHQRGGAEDLAIELCLRLNRESGVEAHLMGLYSEAMPQVAAAKQELLERGIPKIHLLGLNVRPNPLRLLGAVPTFRKIVAREAYDVVETSLPGTSILCIAGLAGTSVGHLIGFHSSVDEANCRSSRVRTLGWMMNRRQRESYYGISKQTARSWADFAGLPDSKVQVIHNSIGASFFEEGRANGDVRSRYGISPQSRVALFIGRLIPRKGVEDAVMALGPLLHARDLHLILVGQCDDTFPGSRPLVEKLKRQISAEGWTDRVHFAGFQSDVRPYLDIADLLLHPTYADGFGLVLAEAMARGLPVVASRVGGIPEVVAETSTTLVEPGDVDGFREAVSLVLSLSGHDRAELIRSLRHRAESFRPESRLMRIHGVLSSMAVSSDQN